MQNSDGWNAKIFQSYTLRNGKKYNKKERSSTFNSTRPVMLKLKAPVAKVNTKQERDMFVEKFYQWQEKNDLDVLNHFKVDSESL